MITIDEVSCSLITLTRSYGATAKCSPQMEDFEWSEMKNPTENKNNVFFSLECRVKWFSFYSYESIPAIKVLMGHLSSLCCMKPKGLNREQLLHLLIPILCTKWLVSNTIVPRKQPCYAQTELISDRRSPEHSSRSHHCGRSDFRALCLSMKSLIMMELYHGSISLFKYSKNIIGLWLSVADEPIFLGFLSECQWSVNAYVYPLGGGQQSHHITNCFTTARLGGGGGWSTNAVINYLPTVTIVGCLVR